MRRHVKLSTLTLLGISAIAGSISRRARRGCHEEGRPGALPLDPTKGIAFGIHLFGTVGGGRCQTNGF